MASRGQAKGCEAGGPKAKPLQKPNPPPVDQTPTPRDIANPSGNDVQLVSSTNPPRDIAIHLLSPRDIATVSEAVNEERMIKDMETGLRHSYDNMHSSDWEHAAPNTESYVSFDVPYEIDEQPDEELGVQFGDYNIVDPMIEVASASPSTICECTRCCEPAG